MIPWVYVGTVRISKDIGMTTVVRFSEVLEKGAKSIVLASHLGRPDGSVVARSQGLELEGFRSFATSLRLRSSPWHQSQRSWRRLIPAIKILLFFFCRYRLILVDICPYLKCTFLDTFIIYKLYHMIQMIHRMHMMHLIHMMHIMIIMI